MVFYGFLPSNFHMEFFFRIDLRFFRFGLAVSLIGTLFSIFINHVSRCSLGKLSILY